MEKSINRALGTLIFGSLFFIALGALTSKSILSLSHVFIVIPCLYFIFKTNWKNIAPSSWAFIGMSIAIILSIAVNQDIIERGMSGAVRSKYFLIGVLSIAPFSWFFLKYVENKEKYFKILFYTFCIATTVATISGIIGQYTGYNPILMKPEPNMGRNGGLFGQLLNYAHNLSYFLIIVFGLLVNKKFTEKYINYKFLLVIFVINIFGFYLTYSRGPWLGFFIGIPFLFFRDIKKFILVSVVVVVAGLGVYKIEGIVAKSFEGSSWQRTESDSIRVSQWKTALEMLKDKPLLGYGYLNFEESTLKVKVENNIAHQNFISHAHSNLMEMLGSTGIIGTLFFLASGLLWFFEMIKRKDIIGNIVASVVVCFFIGGLTQSTILVGINLFLIMAIYSLSQITDRRSKI